MNTKFTQTKLTDFKLQKGCYISINDGDTETILSVWCDTSEDNNTTLRVTENYDNEILIVTVDHADFTRPTISYSDDNSYCYVTFNNHSVHIKLADEGVVFDVWDSENDEEGSVESTYLFYDELAAKEDD